MELFTQCVADWRSRGCRVSKEAMIPRIIAIYKTHEKFDRVTSNSNISFAATRKEPHCPYRLMNILFSDRFAEWFSLLGNVADWVELETRKVANNQLFWEGVPEVFEGQDEAYDNMHFVDHQVLSELHINCIKVVPHSWKNFEQCGRAWMWSIRLL